MILFLLFLISSTLRSSDAQKPRPKIYGAQPIRNAAETYNFFFADFLVGSKYGKLFIIIFSNFTSLKLSFALCHRILTPPVPEIAV